eukprot:scaffold10199_cov146-Cylindrotheca_fusiformis.AAC.3
MQQSQYQETRKWRLKVVLTKLIALSVYGDLQENAEKTKKKGASRFLDLQSFRTGLFPDGFHLRSYLLNFFHVSTSFVDETTRGQAHDHTRTKDPNSTHLLAEDDLFILFLVLLAHGVW